MDDDIRELSNLIRQTSYDIHSYLKHGHLEKIYETALVNRLSKLGLKVESQKPIKVYDEDGSLLGDYFADLVVEDKIIIELKAAKELASEHTAQLLGYLRACKMKHGILINFGNSKFQIKKMIL